MPAGVCRTRVGELLFLAARPSRRSRSALLSFGLPWASELRLLVHQQRVALRCRRLMLSTVRQSSSSEISATIQPGVLAAPPQRDRDRRRRAARRCRRWARRRRTACAGARPRPSPGSSATIAPTRLVATVPAAGVEQRDLPELRKVEHVIPEDARPAARARAACRGSRCRSTQSTRTVVVEVQPDARGDLLARRLVALARPTAPCPCAAS